MLGTNLFIAACVYICLPIVYFTMRNNTVCKNNLILSVTIPPAFQGDQEVMDCCEAFRRNLRRAFWLLTLALVPAVFLPWVSVSLLWSMVWLLAALVVPMWVYGRSFAALKAIKRRRGWRTQTAGQTVVELRPVKLPKRVKTGWFVPPMILSVLPVISCFADHWDPGWRSVLAITAGCNLLVTVLSLVCYGLIFRQRADALDDDLDLTAALTRVRRYNWTKFWLLASWSTALYSLAVWLCQGDMLWYLVWTFVYSAVLIVGALATEFAARRAQHRLTQGRTGTPAVDEDDLWIWGQFYYNPNNNRTLVMEGVGMGMSMNFARPAGKAMAVFSIAVLLAMPLMGVWLMAEELSPVRMELTDEALTVRQAMTTYEIPLDEITDVQLLDTLPPASRTWGTGLSNLLKGSFSVKGYGPCTLCLNPENPPFLLVQTVHGTYLLDAGQAEAILDAYN